MIEYAKLITQATMLRKRLGEDSSSPIDIFAMAESIEGLTIVYYPMGEKLSGMCVKSQKHNNLIAINSAMTLGRQRFSMAHEFYHLFYDDNMVSVCSKQIDSGKDIEKAADGFASYFLMPEDALLRLAEKLMNKYTGQYLELDDVIRIEQYFGVSHQAAVYRLMRTPYLNSDIGNAFLNVAVRRKAEAMGFRSDLYRPTSKDKQYITYGNYINQAEQLLEKGLVSVGRYEELLMEAFRSDLVYGDEEEGGDVID